MDIYKKLFGKEEPNLWYNEKIHYNMVTLIHSFLIYNKATDFTDISEDGIQQEAQKFLKARLTRSEFHSDREPKAYGQKRHDLVVLHSKSGTPMVFYEIKTFIKQKENDLRPSDVYPDFIKLAIQKKSEPKCHVYFILAGKQPVFKKAIHKEGTIILPDKFEIKNNRKSIILTYEFLKKEITHKNQLYLLDKMIEYNIMEISISPSRWKDYSGMAVLSWKINKV